MRVLLVDDDALVRTGLRTILSSAADLVVVGEAGDGAAAVAAVRDLRPDVVLMDVRMPGVDGITATRRVVSEPSPPGVLVLTTFQLDEYVLGALRAGASGFLLKDAPATDILAAVRAVAGGEAVLSPAVTRTVLQQLDDGRSDRRTGAARTALEGLSPRERDVALEVAAGRSNAEIGAALHLSEATVKAHVSRLLTKLGLTNRVQIALLVRDAQLP